MTMTARPYNFSAGPAALPEEVLQQAAAEMLDWHGSGMSVMEMSHRGREFISIAEAAEADLREAYKITVKQDRYKAVDAAKAKPALLAHVAEVGKGDPVHVSFEVADDDVIVRTDGEGAIPLVAEATGLLDAALFGDDGKARTGVGAGAPVEVAIGSGPAPEAMPFDEAMVV